MRKYARLVIALFSVVFAAFVALQFKGRTPSATPETVVRADPTAVVESTSGATQRFKSSHEDVRVRYDRLLTYSDGSSTLMGVTITTEDRADARRSYTVTAKQGKSGQNESSFVLDGDVHLSSTDGLSVRAGHATYTDADGSVNASGPVEFAKGRMRGQGTGMQYDKNRNSLSILENAVIHIDADEGTKDSGPTDVTSATALFLRSDHLLQFTGNVRIRQGTQTMRAEAAAARVTPDEKRVETLELHTNARIDVSSPAPGALQALAGTDMTLTYAADGQSLQRALIVGDAAAQLAGEPGSAGRQIIARTLDVTMGPDGTTPVSLSGQENVRLTLPADASTPARTIEAPKMDSKGEPGRGLTRSTFTGGVQFREKGPATDRVARSATLEAAMEPGTGAIDEARFIHAARFQDGSLTAQGAQALYDVSKGTLQLTGSEPGFTTPRVVNDRIAVDATRIDVGLEGPIVNAAGAVKSTLKPNNDQTGSNDGAKLPSMFKQDQPVTVLADNLAYDGSTSLAVYTGSARLFQADTTIKGNTITIDESRGDLTAVGNAMSSTVREQEGSDHKTQPTRSTGSAADLKYEDATRLLTYTGGAHLVGPEGDITAAKIQLYLQENGDDVDRAEAYADDKEKMTLRETNRTTTGLHMTYTADNETYVVTGVPATVVDDCHRETIGKTLTMFKSTDTIVVDGNQQIRTQTKGGGSGKCQ